MDNNQTATGRLTRALGIAGMVAGLLGGSFGVYALLTPARQIAEIRESVKSIDVNLQALTKDVYSRLGTIEGRLMGSKL